MWNHNFGIINQIDCCQKICNLHKHTHAHYTGVSQSFTVLMKLRKTLFALYICTVHTLQEMKKMTNLLQNWLKSIHKDKAGSNWLSKNERKKLFGI